ncbi:MAG: acetylornithine transaminase [Gammaproteobacteria bacterium]|jgi:acetylornithine/N-succinyldiaminopimelate aminotransferase|nr:acetylornithine transaminase [Gammaproteobacteria bacterium]
MSNTIMPTYGRLPVSFTKGEGAWLWDESGNRYLDALSGIAVCGLGHSHPAVTEAICDQAATLLHTSNLYGIPNQQKLADKLCEISGMDNLFFANSGAEANEAAIKMARLYGHQQKVDNPAIIVAKGSFHGRTLATLSATGNRKVQAGFEPLVKGFVRAPYNNLEALREIASRSREVVAVMVEPIQGEGGIQVPEREYLSAIRQLCDEQNWLMILDEIQTGMGRTGHWFGFQHSDILPDIITLAKGLGNGLPIGACIAQGKAASLFQGGMHGSTFGGNPLVTRAAMAVIDTIEQQNLSERAALLGNRIRQGLSERLSPLKTVKEIRGLGLMIGIELSQPCTALVKQALEQRLLINVTAERVVRLLPPLILSDQEAEQIVDQLSGLIEQWSQSLMEEKP